MEPYQRSMSEAEMLSTLADYVHLQGGYLWHVRDARGQELAGLPDTVIVIPERVTPHHEHVVWRRRGLVAFFELKTQRDRVSPLQAEVLTALRGCDSVVSGLVRPRPKHLGELTLDDALEYLGLPPSTD